MAVKKPDLVAYGKNKSVKSTGAESPSTATGTIKKPDLVAYGKNKVVNQKKNQQTAAKTSTAAQQTPKKQPVDLWQTRTMTDRATQPSAKQKLNSVNERMKNATINGDTDTLLALRPEKKKLESQVYKKAEKKEYTQEQKNALQDLKKRQTEAISLGKTEDVAKLQRQMMDIRAENNRQTLGDRALNTTASILEGSLGQTTNAVGTGVDVARSVVNAIDVHNADYNRRQIAYIRKALADGKTSDGSVLTDAQREAMQKRIQTMQEEIDRWESPDSAVYKAHHVLDKPVSALYQAADEMVSDSAKQQEYAKKNLGAVGSTLVEAAISTGQSYLTDVTGAVTGTGMLPFVVQAFGGATQEARNGGADLTHQVGYGTAEAIKEYITEKMSGLTLPQRLLGKAGAGTFDTMLEKGIRNVTERLASTPGGQRALGGLASWLASGATEGAEEIIGDAIENTLINPTLRQWDPDTRTTQEKFEDALYDGLIGGLSGMIGGVNQLVGYQPSRNAYNVQNGVQAENNVNETVPGTTEETPAAAPAETVTQEQQAQVDAIMEALDRQQELTAAETQQEAAVPAAEAQQERTVPAEVETAREPIPQVTRAEPGADISAAVAQRQFAQLGQSLGENGRKALNFAYDGVSDTGAYSREFLQAYHSGMTGQENPNPNSAVSFAAYNAGQNDAAASLAAEKTAVQSAQTSGEESGLRGSDYEYLASSSGSAVADEVDAVSKALGVRVRMQEQVLNGQANGNISGSEVLIAEDAEDPALQVVGHEWTHRVQELAPKEYRTFRDAVTSIPEVQDAAEILLDRYNRAGVNISYEQALDEATANYSGKMIRDGNVLDDFIRKHGSDRTMLQKLRDAIHEIVGKLTGRAKKQAQTVEGKLQAAFEAASRQAKTLQAESGNDTMGATRYSLEDMTEGERAALLQYKSSESYKVNAKLRDGQPLTDTEKRMVADLDTALEKLPTVNRTVYRTLNFDAVFNPEAEFGVFMEEHAEGNVVDYNAFTSVSTKADGYPLVDGTKHGVTIEISGNSARDLAGIGNNFESEALFPRKTAFSVRSVSTDKSGYTHIVMEEIQDNAQRNKSEHDAQKRSQTVQQVQKEGKLYRNLPEVPKENTTRSPNRGGLPGVRGEEIEKVKFSLKEDSTGRELTEAQQEYFKDSKAVDEDGRLLTMYHQTDGVFTVFDPKHEGAGTRDNGTPFGIFLKTSKRDIGLRGKNQMELYVNLKNPLRVQNRDELTSTLRKMSPEYDRILQEHKALDTEYKKKTDNAIAALKDFMISWRAEHKGEDGRKLYDIPEFNKLFDAEDTIAEEWTSKADELSTRAKEVLTNALRNAGYDGVILHNDAGSFGRSTDAYIALSPEQVKNVSNQNPTKDPDIRYSLKEYSDQEKRDHRKEAIAYFGKTYNWNETGYLTPAGTKLDFSGRHEGGPGGYRTVDHRDIRDAIGEDYGGDDYSGSMVQFMSEGNIRISPESGGINLSVEPTKSQLDALSDFISKNRGEVILDLDTTDGQTVSSTEYPRGTHSSKVLNDIKAYFKDGTKPYVSELAQFLSLKGADAQEMAALKRENDRLKERVEYWRGQTKRSKGVTTDKKSVTKAADALVKDYGAEIQGSEIAGELQSLYDYIASGRDGKDELTYTEARRRSDAIAEKIAESAVAVDDQMYQEYTGLRKFLKTQKITLSAQDAANITDYGDWRKSLLGKMNVSKGEHSNIDQIYSELSEQYPEFFDPQRDSSPDDQLQRMADVASQLYKITEYNPFDGYMGQAVASISNDIMDRFFDLPQAKKTFADRQAEQVQNARAAGKQAAKDAFLAGQMAQGRQDAKRLRSVNQALAKERTRRAKQVQALKDRYQARDAARRDTQNRKELRAKIIRHANALSQKLLRPTDKQHVPEEFRSSVAAVLNSINQESSYTLDENGRHVRDGSGTPTGRTTAFLRLKDQYQRIAAENGMVIDPSLFGEKINGQEARGAFDEVIDMGDTRLADLSREQLQTMWNVLKSVEHAISTAGKTLASEKFETTRAFADAFQTGTMTRRHRKGGASISLETPYTFFTRYGQAGEAVYRMLRDAQDRQELMSRDVEEMVHQILSDKPKGTGIGGRVAEARGNTVWKMNTDTHEFTTSEGKKLTLTPAQAMEIYLLSKRPQAQTHLMEGGIVQPEIKSGITGKTKIERGTEFIRLSLEDLKAISGSLTAEEVRIADELQKLTTGVLANYGNEASMKAYGYKKFTEESYWPIHSAKEALHTNVEKSGDNPRSIKNIGMAQAVQPNATTALDISGVFDTFSQHASDMIDYAAWLCPMEDANRLFNFEFRTESGEKTGRTLKGLLEDKGGKGSQQYWTKLMADIQNGIGNRGFEPWTGKFAKGVGRFKGAAVGANIRVIIQQPTAFFRASVVLNAKDMARGLTGGVTKGSGWEKALKYSPIAMRKDVGSFDISSPYTLSDRFYGKTGVATKINDAAGKGAGAADAITWGALWNACEWQVKRESPNLRAGSSEFYSAVNRVFTNMIDQTQVVDGILQRPNIMRSEKDLAQQATAFMGEPIMSLNVMMRAYDNFKYEQNPQKRGKALKTVGRAATALVTTNVVNALAQSIVDGIRDDDRDKDYWERVLSAFTGITGSEENWAQYLTNVLFGNVGSNMNPIANVPFVKDVLSIWQGYDVSRPDMETFSDLVDATKTAIDSAGGTGKKTRKEALLGLFAAAGKMMGLPAYNVKRDTMAAVRTIAVQSGNIPFQYEVEKFTYNIGNAGNKSRFMSLLYAALEQGDYTSFNHMREDLMENMPDVTGKSIDSSMASLYKKKKEKDPDYKLPQKSMDYIGTYDAFETEEKEDAFDSGDLDAKSYDKYASQRQDTYRKAEDVINSSNAFQSADNETKNKALKNAKDFAEKTALADNSSGEYKISENSWILKAQEAQEKYGIDPGTYSMLRAQISGLESWKDENGDTIKNSKGYQIMQVINDSGLTQKQKTAMYEYLDVPKGIRHMNKAAVKEQLERMKKRTEK